MGREIKQRREGVEEPVCEFFLAQEFLRLLSGLLLPLFSVDHLVLLWIAVIFLHLVVVVAMIAVALTVAVVIWDFFAFERAQEVIRKLLYDSFPLRKRQPSSQSDSDHTIRANKGKIEERRREGTSRTLSRA